MSRYLIDQIESTEETLVKVSSEVASVTGADHLEAVTVRNSKSGETETVPAEAILVFIGAAPNSDPATDVVELDDTGYVLTRSDLMRDGRRPKN